MRVLFLNDTARNGGPGRSLQALLRHIPDGRVHRTVVLPRAGEIADLLRSTGAADEIAFEPAWVENLVEPWSRPMARDDFAASRPLQTLRALGNVARMSQAIWRLARRVKEGRFDVIYGNGTTANFVVALLGLWLNVPVVWHVRYTSIPGPLERLHRALAATRAVRRIVCVSKPAAALLAHVPEKVVVVHNGVDVDAFTPGRSAGGLRTTLGLGEDVVIFGSHGRILRKKGYVEMLTAARVALTLLRADERPRCHFVIIGDTPQDFRPDHLAECRQLAATLGIEKNVTFLGFKADVRPFLADFDVTVVPSIYPDPLPRAVIESMAAGKPVLAFDVGGVGEMLGSGEGTLLKGRPPDVQGLALSFVRYLRDPVLRATQSQAARARALRDFDARGHAAKVEVELFAAAGRVGPAPRFNPSSSSA